MKYLSILLIIPVSVFAREPLIADYFSSNPPPGDRTPLIADYFTPDPVCCEYGSLEQMRREQRRANQDRELWQRRQEMRTRRIENEIFLNR